MTYALTVAGFDGSAGAGFVADIKTMAHFGVYGQAVCTALTEQNEEEFIAPGWVIWDRIEAQLATLYKKHKFKYVKIGLVEKAKILKRIVEFVRNESPDAFIVWDPIASASAGFHFMRDAELDEFLPVMKSIDLVTPNQDEFAYLGLGLAASRGYVELGKDFAVLLKGGHAAGRIPSIRSGMATSNTSLRARGSPARASTARAACYLRQSLRTWRSGTTCRKHAR